MPARNRPAKRVLNRWSDDLDKGVLLCVQYACAEAGLKIPWGRVAALMGPTFTEGSIVQHLAKLRNIMARLGIPVPPAVKRGMVTKEPSKIYTSAGNKVKLEPIAPMFPEAPGVKEEAEGEEKASIYDKPKRSRKKDAVQDTEPKVKKEPKAKAKGKGKAKGRHHLANEEDDDNEPVPDLYDSDDEYPPPKKRRGNNSKSKKKEAVTEASATIPDGAIPSAVSPIEAPGADKNVAVKLEQEELTGPARRTRGIKRDYSVMAAPSDDDDAEFDEEVPPYVDEDLEGGFEDMGVDDETSHSGGINGDIDDMDDASSEVSTVVLGHQQATSGILPQQNVADLPYGQIISTMDGHSTTFPFTHLSTLTGAAYGSHGHAGVGIVNHNSFSGAGLGYSGAAIMTTMPRAYPASQFPSMSMYDSSTDSSRNNSIGADMMFQTLPSMSENEFLTAHTGFGHGNTGDIINEEDMMNSMANEDIFWNDGDYLVDDA